MHETIDMRGAVTVRLENAAGEVVHHQHRHNRIVKSGRANVAKLFAGVTSGTPPARVTHVGVGTDNHAAVDDDAALGAERARTPFTDVAYSDVDDTSTGTTVKRTRVSLTAVFDFGEANGSAPLCEAGVFTAATGGVMYNRVTLDPVTKTNAFKLTVLWDIIF